VVVLFLIVIPLILTNSWPKCDLILLVGDTDINLLLDYQYHIHVITPSITCWVLMYKMFFGGCSRGYFINENFRSKKILYTGAGVVSAEKHPPPLPLFLCDESFSKSVNWTVIVYDMCSVYFS
jgi:hypothetical protein